MRTISSHHREAQGFLPTTIRTVCSPRSGTRSLMTATCASMSSLPTALATFCSGSAPLASRTSTTPTTGGSNVSSRTGVAPLPAFTASAIFSAKEWASLSPGDVNTSNLTAGNWLMALLRVACCAGVKSRSASRSFSALQTRPTPPMTTRVKNTPNDRSRMWRPLGKKNGHLADQSKDDQPFAQVIEERRFRKEDHRRIHVR